MNAIRAHRISCRVSTRRCILHLHRLPKLHVVPKVPRIVRSVPEGIDEGLYRDAEKSTKLLDQLVQHIGRSQFVDAAADYVTGEETIGSSHRRQVIKSAVAERLEEMNDTFLPTLMSYIEALNSQVEDPKIQAVVAMLEDIREEVLEQLSECLPVHLQIMNKLLTAPSSGTRVSLLEHFTSGNDATLTISIEELSQNTESVIIDMERMPQVPDSRLLARLCLLREEIAELQQKQGAWFSSKTPSGNAAADTEKIQAVLDNLSSSSQSNSDASEQGLPAYTLSFLKNILLVPLSETRRAMLVDAFKTGMGVDLTAQEAAEKAMAGEVKENVLLPGQFLLVLNTVQKELLDQVEGGKLAVEEGVLIRLEDLRRDTISVLVDLSGEDIGYSP